MMKHHVVRQILYRKVGEQMKIHSTSVEVFVELRNKIAAMSIYLCQKMCQERPSFIWGS